jgi:hypothetical protein
MGTTTKMHPVRHADVCPTTADAIRKSLEHARAAGILTSFDGAFAYDPSTREVFFVIAAENMHPAERDCFGCECLVADTVVARAIARHRGPSSPPRGL